MNDGILRYPVWIQTLIILFTCQCLCTQPHYRNSHPEAFFKKGILKNFAKNPQEKTCVGVSSLIKLQP